MFIHISFLEIKVLRAYTSVVIGFIVYWVSDVEIFATLDLHGTARVVMMTKYHQDLWGSLLDNIIFVGFQWE